MEPQELKAWLRLALTAGVGNETARKLLAAFASPEGIFEQSHAVLKQLGNDKLASAVQAKPDKLDDQLQITLDWLAGDADRQIAVLGDSAYPASLLNTEDPPLMLYMLGAQSARSSSATPCGSGRGAATRPHPGTSSVAASRAAATPASTGTSPRTGTASPCSP